MILCIFMIIRTKNIVGLPFYPTMYPLCTPYDSEVMLRCAHWFCLQAQEFFPIGTRLFAYRHKLV